MVGFSIVMDFLTFCLVGVFLAAIMGGLFASIGRWLLPISTPGRRKFLWMCFMRPFLGIPWVFFVFVAYSYANGMFFHRDNGMGVNAHAPLRDGYILGFVNYDGCWLVPETISGEFPNLDPGAVEGVIEVQIADPYILGSRHVSGSSYSPDDGVDASTEYFLIDTRTRVVTYLGMDGLNSSAALKGISVSLEPAGKVFSRFRPTWFDWTFPFVSVLGLAGQLASLFVKAMKLRHQAPHLPDPAPAA